MQTFSSMTRTFAERAKREGDWCVVGHAYQAINPTPSEALDQ